MEFRLIKGTPLDGKADLLALGVFGDPAKDELFKAADKATGGLLATIAREQRFVGKDSQQIVARTDGMSGVRCKSIAVFGYGDRERFKLADLRDHAARVAATGSRIGAGDVAFVLPALDGDDRALAARLVVEGAVLGSYKFDKYQTRDKDKDRDKDRDRGRKPPPVKRFGVLASPTGENLAAAESRALGAAIRHGEVVGQAVCHTRDLVNEPAGFMTPTRIAEEARTLARKHGLTIKVLGQRECERLKMGMFLAVAKGSVEEPKFIHMTYTPPGKSKGRSRIAIIGKGVMFDSGGYSLKPSNAMEDMKMDMSGAAAVITAISAIAQLGCKHEVHAIAACCENLISGSAYKLRDVLIAMDGTTVEINNTDAEGRLTLGDAITYARTKIKPDEILDFATLTGSCMIALGPHTAGVLSDTEDMVARWLACADRAGEDMWRLPLSKKLKSQLDSPVADMRNTGERWGGALTAGLFLQHFARDSRWVHVDLAGPAMASRSHGAVHRGGTGFGVASIVEYITSL